MKLQKSLSSLLALMVAGLPSCQAVAQVTQTRVTTGNAGTAAFGAGTQAESSPASDFSLGLTGMPALQDVSALGAVSPTAEAMNLAERLQAPVSPGATPSLAPAPPENSIMTLERGAPEAAPLATAGRPVASPSAAETEAEALPEMEASRAAHEAGHAWHAVQEIQESPVSEFVQAVRKDDLTRAMALGRKAFDAARTQGGESEPAASGVPDGASPSAGRLARPSRAARITHYTPAIALLGLVEPQAVQNLLNLDPATVQNLSDFSSRMSATALLLAGGFTLLYALNKLRKGVGWVLGKRRAAPEKGTLAAWLLPGWLASFLFAAGTAALFWTGAALNWTWAVPAAAALLLWAALSYVDMKRLDFKTAAEDYGQYHRNKINKIFHKIGIPLIMLSIIQWTQVPSSAFPWFPWAAVFLPLYALWDLPLAIAMAGIVAGMAAIAFYFMNPWIALGVFVLGWIFQLIGHKIEGRQPAFTKNAIQLLVGPMWILNDIRESLRFKKKGA